MMKQNDRQQQGLEKMQQQLGSSHKQSYINLVKESYGRKSYLPSYEVKFQLGGIRQKLLEEKQAVMEELRQQRLLQETIGEEELERYYAKKKQSDEYNLAIGMLKRIKGIYELIQQLTGRNHFIVNSQDFDKDIQNLPSYLENQTNKYLNSQQQAFANLIHTIEQFHIFYNTAEQIGQTINKNSKKPIIQSHTIFQNKFYVQLMQRVINKRQSSNQNIKQKIQEIIKKYNLPVKRNQKPKERENIKLQIQDKLLIQRLLHREACQYALYTYLSTILISKNGQSSLNQQCSLPLFRSVFFSIFYSKLQSSIEYLFIEKHESHSFIEPNWMFEYIQQVFVGNYQWVRTNVLQGLNAETEGNLLVYLLQYSITNLFFTNIKDRLQTDLTFQEFTNNPLHYYKFLDSLYQLQQKLNITFSQQFNLVQNLLIDFQLKNKQHIQLKSKKQMDEQQIQPKNKKQIQPKNKKQIQLKKKQQISIDNKNKILERCFDYEHDWIQQKIFKDFWQNINYSAIDLKNIETYNIVTNFNVLFQKLYTKFSTLYEPQLVKKVFRFYQQQVKNLVAHIKTSLERIFYHSGLDRLSVILAFKRVDNEFRSGLGQFISKDLQFEKYIKKEYYDYILQLFTQLAVQQLAVYSRKTLKAVTQLQHLFTVQSITQDEHALLTNRCQQIYKKWSNKLQQLNLVYPVKDVKIKNQFFVFLQSIQFTQKGITLFLEFYQPFLKVYYNSQMFNLLKMVILMDKKQQLDYLKGNVSGGNVTNFLLQTEINAIKRMKIN